MASEEQFECTQIIQTSFVDTPSEDATSKVQVASLILNGLEHPIFNGDTKIGRDPKQCLVAIDRKSVSFHHALIEVESGHHILSDLGSSNSTRLNGMLLKPNVRYNISDGSVVQVADLRGTYHILPLKKPELETSVQDIFDSPSCSTMASKRLSLDESDDIIQCTPLKSEFKMPYLKRQSSTFDDSIHLQDTIGQNQNEIYEAETQIGSHLDEGSIIMSETLDDSVNVAAKDASSFFIPCTQDALSESSLKLHYSTDNSVGATETTGGTVPIESARQEKSRRVSEVDMFLNAEEPTVSDPGPSDILKCQTDQDDMDCADLVRHVEKIERSFSSESMKQETVDHLSPNKQPAGGAIKSCAEGVEHPNNVHDDDSETDDEGLVRDIHDAKTQCPFGIDNGSEDGGTREKAHTSTRDVDADIHNAATQALGPDVHDAKTQIVDAIDSETDEEGMYEASTEKPESSGDIHDAKTQRPGCDVGWEPVTGGVNMSASDDAVNIHDAKTQLVIANGADSDTDEEGVYGACTEMPHRVGSANASEGEKKGSDDIHDAKTQFVSAEHSDSDTDEEGVYGACTEMPHHVGSANASEGEKKGSDDIHDAKTQFVSAEHSDSDTDEEGVYGAGSEIPASSNTSAKVIFKKKDSEDIHDARTQIVPVNTSDSDTDEEGVYGASTEKPQILASGDTSKDAAAEENESEEIHNAKTQFVVANNSASENDQGDIYGACTEMPGSTQNIHDAKTQLVIIESVSKSQLASESILDMNTIEGDEANIHDAKTQIVSKFSDSETDDERVYGASTERPGNMAEAFASEEDVSENKELQGIHDAKTQMIHSNDSDSETDEEGVFDASTEKPAYLASKGGALEKAGSESKQSEDIHDAKTKIEGLYGACTEQSHDVASDPGSEDIHGAKTQIISANDLGSETDEEGVYGACTERLPELAVDSVPSSSKTSIMSNDTPSKALGREEEANNIHTASTQIIPSGIDKTGSSGNQTSDVALHDAETQILPELLSDSGSVHHENVSKQSIAPRGSPKKRLSLSYRKKIGANDDCKRRSVSPCKETKDRKETEGTNEDDISTAATQLLPNVEEDICSAATQICESPRFSRRLKDKATNENETPGESSVASPKTPSPGQSRKSEPSTPYWTAKSNLRRGSKSSEEEVSFSATQILPSPVPSRKTRSQNSQDNVNLCDSSEVIPSQRRSPSKNLNHISSGPSNRTSTQNSLKETDKISEPSSVLHIPITPRRTPNKTSSQETSIFSTQVSPSPGSSRRTRDPNLTKEKCSSSSAPHIEGIGKSFVKESTVPSPKSAEILTALVSTELRRNDLISPKPSSSRRSVSFANNIQVLSNPGCTTVVAGIEKLTKPRSKRSPKKQPSSEKQVNKKKRHLGSSMLEADIEESSSDSNKSQDCLIDEGSPLPAQENEDNAISDAEEPVLGATSTSAQSPINNVKHPQTPMFEPESTSPIVSQSRGRRTLSLSRSKFSSQGFQSSEVRIGKISPDDSAPKLEGLMPSSTEPKDETPNKITENMTVTTNSQPSKDEAAAKAARIISSPIQPKNEESNESKTILTVTRNSQPPEDDAAAKGSKLASSLEGSTLKKKDNLNKEPKRKGASTKGKRNETTNSQPNVPAAVSVAGCSSQTSNSSVSSNRRSSRLKKPTAALEDYDCSGESQSQEAGLPDQVSAASSSDHTKGRNSGRNTKQKDNTKSGPSVKGTKRLSSGKSDQETVPRKKTRTKCDLSLTLETSVQTAIVLDESAGPSSLKRENTLNDSISSEAGPKSKRRRGRLDSVASSNTSPRRSTRQSVRGATPSSTIRVLFSFYNNPKHESFIKQLGGSIVDNVDTADVLVTDKLRRTVKLLSMVGKGLPVVSPAWLVNCKRTGRLLDPWEHLLTDVESEGKFNMKLEESLRKAVGHAILQDYNIFITKNVKPVPEEMKAIILSCGGHCLPHAPSVWPANSFVISCEEDKNDWNKFKGKVAVMSAEWLLSGVMRQQLEHDQFVLKKI